MALVRFANYLFFPPLIREGRRHVFGILLVGLISWLGDGQASIAQSTAPDVGVRFQPPTAVLLTNATIVVSSDRTLAAADLLIR